ncbi:MAG: glutamate--cysteine ligase [Candidatus Thiodiazotropha sp.]
MGQEIPSSRFGEEDFTEFRHRLEAETRLLSRWFDAGRFTSPDTIGGLELEACLLDAAGDPAPRNQTLLEGFDEPLVVPELATFNLEFNTRARPLHGDVFSRMADELGGLWRRCSARADELALQLGMIGILPTLRPHMLTLANMSPLNRYRALNEQIFRLRNGQPISLSIDGRESLQMRHEDVMLESAATSFQIHMQVDISRAADLYNLSKIVSAPMVAIMTKRVSFGIRYVYESMMENFSANLLRYPILLPLLMDEPVERLAHLRLHNGTIWRWNRPLIGFDEKQRPHLRIEHRVVPAGPSISDSIANAAFYFGLVTGLLEREDKPVEKLRFDRARSNFYAAAREGLQAQVAWFDIERVPLGQLISEHLIGVAGQGLASLAIDPQEIAHWLGIVKARVAGERTGAAWQRAWVARHGPDFHGLMQTYLAHQESGKPVHEWPV